MARYRVRISSIMRCVRRICSAEHRCGRKIPARLRSRPRPPGHGDTAPRCRPAGGPGSVGPAGTAAARARRAGTGDRVTARRWRRPLWRRRVKVVPQTWHASVGSPAGPVRSTATRTAAMAGLAGRRHRLDRAGVEQQEPARCLDRRVAGQQIVRRGPTRPRPGTARPSRHPPPPRNAHARSWPPRPTARAPRWRRTESA